MDNGRYFRLDTDASIIEQGLAIFRYRPDGERDCSIYATITAESVDFDVVSVLGSSRALTIPLGDTLDLSLAATLARNFRHVISFPEFLPFAAAMSEHGDKRGYFATFVDCGKGIKEPSHPWTRWVHSKKDELPLAKLILDFLFDLQETRVFRISPRYGELTKKLRGDFFFRALAAKAAFLYSRALHQIAAKHGQATGQDRRERRRFYGELFFAAEKKWTDCIRDPRSVQAFHNSGGWFNGCEAEMKRVYRPWLSIRLGAEQREARAGNNAEVSRWLVQRYASSPAWGLCLRHRSFFGPHMLLPRLIAAIAAAWFTFPLMGEDMNLPEFLDKDVSTISPVLSAMTLFILLTSCISIGKFAPLAGRITIFLRAISLAVVSLLISALIGLTLHLMLGEPSSWREFEFFCVASAYAGIIFQIFLNDKNPSEPI